MEGSFVEVRERGCDWTSQMILLPFEMVSLNVEYGLGDE